jgi:uncharacterized phage-associated protein
MTLSAHDIACELRGRLAADPNGLGVVRLHKLLYYAQAWHLVVTRKPLFRERIEAWANGPVVAELWADEAHDRVRPEPQRLGPEHLATVDYVLSRYGSLSGHELIRLSHDEDPWRAASERDDSATDPSPELTPAALVSFFSQDPAYPRYRAEVERHYRSLCADRRRAVVEDPAYLAGIDRALAEVRAPHARPT